MEKGKFANIRLPMVESYLHIKENPKASFDQFESFSFNSFLLSANHVSNVDVKMSHALSIVLQVQTQCVHHYPFSIGFRTNFMFVLTIFNHQVIKRLFPGGIGSSVLVSFSQVEHLNLAYIQRFPPLTPLMTLMRLMLPRFLQ